MTGKLSGKNLNLKFIFVELTYFHSVSVMVIDIQVIFLIFGFNIDPSQYGLFSECCKHINAALCLQLL
jgi:hypothetical protein